MSAWQWIVQGSTNGGKLENSQGNKGLSISVHEDYRQQGAGVVGEALAQLLPPRLKAGCT